MADFIQSYFDQLKSSFQQLKSSLEVTGLLVGLGATVFATLVFFLLVKLVRRFAANLEARIVSRVEFIQPLRFQRQEIFSAEDIVKISTSLVTGFKWVFYLILLYLYLNAVFSFFPATEAWAEGLLNLVVAAFGLVISAFVGYLPNLIIMLVIVLLARYLVRLASLIFDGIASGRITIPGFYREWAGPTFNIFRFLMVAGTLVVIFPYIPGSGSDAFRGVSIFLGVLFSLGSTSAVANVVAGVVITYKRAFQVGDRVRIADTEGDIVEKTLFVARIRTTKNVEVTIPNSMVLSNHIINYSALARKSGLVLHTTVTIGYDVPWEKVHELLIAAAKATEGVKSKLEPFVLQTSLDDFYVSYELNAHTNRPNQMAAIYSALHQNIQTEFHKGGVEITSPHFSAIRDGNQTTVPNPYLPSDYQPPAFRIHPLERFFSGKKEDK